MNPPYDTPDRPASVDIPGERLLALWRLSVRPDLDDEARIRAMLGLACEMFGTELAVLGEFTNGGYTVRYVHDKIGAVSEGVRATLDNLLCRDIVLTGRPRRHNDLSANPDYRAHPLVADSGLRMYYGVPVSVAGVPGWALAFMRRAVTPALTETDMACMALVSDWLGNALFQSQRAAHLTELALTDALTGLPNRRAAEEILQKESARIERDASQFGLALVDLDYFKSVNDRYGHAVGDELLRTVAQRFAAGLRQGDWVARWGGEEFLFFLHGSCAQTTRATLERLAESLKNAPPVTSIGPLAMTFSAGVARVAPGGLSVEASLERLDAALYRCKSSGRDRVLPVQESSRQWGARELRRALDEDRLRVATQPIVALADGRVVADEALARLRLDDGQWLVAANFIDQAEGLGLVAEIDRRVIRATMQRCVAHLAAGGSMGFAHFVNLSPHFMARPDLVTEMLANARAYCSECGVEMADQAIKPIVLEITERQRVLDLERLRAELQPFVEFGYRLALDDFGSGYSSYLYLAHLPVSFLKIEGWLVANMTRERRAARIVESLAEFARKEGLITIAEHVEDADTARRLVELGVDWGQGWHFGRPQLVDA